MIHLGNISTINWKDVEAVDCVVGGSPCQNFSTAGDRTGLNGHSSNIFYEYIRCVKELREIDAKKQSTIELIRPRYLVFENVCGVLHTNNGEDFKKIVEEIVRLAEPKAPNLSVPKLGWPNAGIVYDELGRWSVAWRVHNSKFWGTAQHRERLAVVADFAGLSAAEILFERKGLLWDSEQNNEEKVGAAKDIYGCASTTSARIYDARGRGNGVICPTIIQGENRVTDYTAIVVENNTLRRLTPLECERMQGLPDNWTDIGVYKDTVGRTVSVSDTTRYKAIGNSIATPFWFYILRRLSSQYERMATLGSLFDGIGAFPMIWEQLNGRNTARWASEIDSFCVAVTKKHFGEQ